MIDEIAAYLEAQGLGTRATNIFTTYMPASPDNLIVIDDTHGLTPDPYLKTEQPTFQVSVRNTDFTAGETVFYNVRNTLHQLTNKQLVTNGTYFYNILLTGSGGSIGRDNQGRELWSLNFKAFTR